MVRTARRSSACVAGDGQDAGDGALGLDQGGEGEGVGGDDLRRRGVFAGHDKLITGCDKGHDGAAGDGDLSDIHRGKKGKVMGGQAARRQGVAGAEILSQRADVWWRYRRRD